MNRIRFVLVGMSATAALAASAFAQPVLQPDVPDFSQFGNPNWRNYCVPTTGMDVVFHFGFTLPNMGLTQGVLSGQSSLLTPLIGDPFPGTEPPPPGSMADLMGTTFAAGTTPANLRGGLDNYLEDRWDGTPGGADWTTDLILSDPAASGPGGMGFWNELQTRLSAGHGVILLIHWLGALPNTNVYNVPGFGQGDEGYQELLSDPNLLIDPNLAIGHAVTMTGFDALTQELFINDPADNMPIGVQDNHNWSNQNLLSPVTINANNISIPLGGTTATIYGAVTTLIPAPGAGAILALAFLAGGRRRSPRP